MTENLHPFRVNFAGKVSKRQLDLPVGSIVELDRIDCVQTSSLSETVSQRCTPGAQQFCLQFRDVPHQLTDDYNMAFICQVLR